MVSAGLKIWHLDADSAIFVCRPCHRELRQQGPPGAGRATQPWQQHAAWDLTQWEWEDGRCQHCELSYEVAGTSRPGSAV